MLNAVAIHHLSWWLSFPGDSLPFFGIPGHSQRFIFQNYAETWGTWRDTALMNLLLKIFPSLILSFFHLAVFFIEILCSLSFFFEKLCAEESEIQPLNATRIATPNGRIKNIIATEAQWSGQKDNGAWERPWRHWSEGAPDGRSIEYHPIIDW